MDIQSSPFCWPAFDVIREIKSAKGRVSYRIFASIEHRHADRGHQLVLLHIVVLIVPCLVLVHKSLVLLLHVGELLFVIDQKTLLLFIALMLLPQPIGYLRICYVGIYRGPDGRMISTTQNQGPRHHRHVFQHLVITKNMMNR